MQREGESEKENQNKNQMEGDGGVEWWRFWERAAVGRTIGRLLVPGSVLAAMCTLLLNSGAKSRGTLPLITSCGGAFVAGLWLWRRKYLRDPAALRGALRRPFDTVPIMTLPMVSSN
jgi:hypothetical protein